MKKSFVVILLGALSALVGCGGKVLVDGFNGGGGGGGEGSASCPTSQPDDKEVQDLVGKSCDTDAKVCASNNGCGGCSVSCKNGAWVSTNAMLCTSIPDC